MGETRWVPIGKISRPHGVRGAVKIFPYGDSLSGVDEPRLLYLKGPADAEPRGVRALGLEQHGRYWIATFEGFADRNRAETLSGQEVVLPEEELPATGEDEYYHFQLHGLEVRTVDGRVLGRIVGIFEAGEHDIFVARGAGPEILIPAVNEFIREVDLESGRMIVDLPEGLADGI